jgi:hypothetical protein
MTLRRDAFPASPVNARLSWALRLALLLQCSPVSSDEEKYLAWGGDKVLIKACKITDLEKAIQQCFLTPKYEREFHYKSKILQEQWQEIGQTEWVKKNMDLECTRMIFFSCHKSSCYIQCKQGTRYIHLCTHTR